MTLQRRYSIKNWTGKNPDAGTNSTITIKLYGTASNSKAHALDANFDRREDGWGGETVVQALDDHGSIWRIELTNEGHNDWYCDEIEISSPEAPPIRTTHFGDRTDPGHRIGWIKGSQGAYSFDAREMKPGGLQSLPGQTLMSPPIAYVVDNQQYDEPRGVSEKVTLQVSETKQASTESDTSQTSELTLKWDSPDTAFGSFGAEYKGTWSDSVKRMQAIDQSEIATAEADYQNMLMAPPRTYAVIIIQEEYTFSFEKVSDGLNAFLLRGMAAKPAVQNPRSFIFGGDKPQTYRLAEFQDKSWTEAIQRSMGAAYASLLSEWQKKGWLV